ncbi:uncharacterized protein PRCAT00005012001 [Priceomyces carsonii]|uniref:uncharacterized protein n=1 Tax=Priceomyces carsonii TaxID=28549 RepID=UPI002ED89237|nr:unnamed protein product [Priceomyces carsonii]
MGFFKRSVSYEGMDCLKDMDKKEYMAAMLLLQKEIPWADQTSYGKYTVYFGVVVIFLATVKSLWYRYRDRAYKQGRSLTWFGSLLDVIMSYLRYLGYKQVPRKIRYFTSLPPSLGSSLFYFASSLYLFCYCLVPHFWYRDCAGFGSPPLAVRSGIMATALTPFIYVLSGKSNVVTLLTGISYEKLNTHHQYVGVCAFILSIIHTIPFIYQSLHEGGAKNLHVQYSTNVYYRTGIAPLVLLGWLCIASKACIRNILYEGFLHLHWLCGIAYFGTLIWHIDKSLGCDDYMWGALAFWATQIIYRILVKTAFRPNSLFMRPRRALLRKINYNSYEIVIDNTKGSLKWSPGQHCFLRFIGKKFIDNHPFSISSIPSEDQNEMKFIIVPKKGLTRDLFNQLDENSQVPKKVYIDGPYGGCSRDVTAFENVILICTGSGVSATLPFLSYMANTFSQSKNENITLPLRNIHFIWIIRHRSDLDWIASELNRCIDVLDGFISVDIYVTRPEEKEEHNIEKEKDPMKADLEIVGSPTEKILPFVSIHYFKPSVMNIVSRSMLLRRNFIASSGSDSMRCEVSKSVSRLQAHIFNNDINKAFIEEIFLHTETFGW